MIVIGIIWGALKRIPWQVYAGIALAVLIFFARLHWIDVGVGRCQATQAAAQQAALAESIKQEITAPAIAQAEIEAVKPKVIERIKVIRENIPVNSCPDYPISVQAVIREAAAAAD